MFGPHPVRQWVLSVPYPLRFLFASKPDAIGPVLGIVQRVIAAWLTDQAGVERNAARTGACATVAYPTDCREGAHEVPIPRLNFLYPPCNPSDFPADASRFLTTPRGG